MKKILLFFTFPSESHFGEFFSMSKNAGRSWTWYCKDNSIQFLNVRFWSFMVVTVNKWSKKVRKCKIRTRTITTFVLVDCFVPVDFRIHRVITAGLRPARIAYPQWLSRGLQIPENKVFFHDFSVNILPAFRLVPVDFRIHRENNCGSANRADGISAISASGITNPREQRGQSDFPWLFPLIFFRPLAKKRVENWRCFPWRTSLVQASEARAFGEFRKTCFDF